MDTLNNFSYVKAADILAARKMFGTPVYLYDEGLIIDKCKAVMAMPNAYGLTVRYAMKANPNKTILRIIDAQGLLIDASSLNEAKRANMAGIALSKIILTTQDVPEGGDRADLERMMLGGLMYNVCSLRQLTLVADFVASHKLDISIRIHPGVGTGETASRNTGDNYSCFGVHLSDIQLVLQFAADKGVTFKQVHAHIGSGGDEDVWKRNIDLELELVEKYFLSAEIVSFGGGLKEARMPSENQADIETLGAYAKKQFELFYQRTGRKLTMEIEPGTYIAANSGFAVTTVMDKKRTGPDGMDFIIADGGMDINTRPLMYGSVHPFYMVSQDGRLMSSEFNGQSNGYEAVVVGRCCESGDSQCIDREDVNHPRQMAEPEIGDILVIGGAGAYCSAMSPFNYNSYTQAPEALLTRDGQMTSIRKRQTLEQIVMNEE